MSNISQFFEIARERERMRQRRAAGEPWPWTQDGTLAHHRFCNVHREQDRATAWFREQVRGPMSDALDPRVFMACYIFRWFNKIETCELLKDLMLGNFDIEEARRRLHAVQGPVFGAAYIIQSPTGMSKIDGILWCIGNVTKRWMEGADFCGAGSLERVHEWLMRHPHMGPFMAYQVVCDLRQTYLLRAAWDLDTWTCAGPGSARGLSWLYHDNPHQFNYNTARDQQTLIARMRELLEVSRQEWPRAWGEWELATVQHWACEYDKWRRGQNGERLKRRYPIPETGKES